MKFKACSLFSNHSGSKLEIIKREKSPDTSKLKNTLNP